MTNKGNQYKFQAIQERRMAEGKQYDIYSITKKGTPAKKPIGLQVIRNNAEAEIERLEKLNPGKKFIAVFK